MQNELHMTGSEEATEALGASLAAQLTGGTVVALHGNLGAGKTVLARGIARGLGITEPITSPTFSIVQEYPGGRLQLYHMDMYRLQSDHDALAFGIDEYLHDEQAVCVIEWAERIAGLLPPTTIQVYLSRRDQEREIRISRTT